MSSGPGPRPLRSRAARAGRWALAATAIGLTGTTATAAASWSAAVAALPEPVRVHSLVPHLVVSPGGAGYLAVDTQLVGGPGLFGPARGRAIRPDGSLGPVETVAAAGEQPHQLGLGITAGGAITAAYTSGNGIHARVLVRLARPGGGFAAARHVTRPGVRSALSRLLVAPDGLTALLLQAGTGASARFALYAGPRSGPFRRVATLPARAQGPAMAMAADHRAVLAWTVRLGPRRFAVQAAGWSPRGALDISTVARVRSRYAVYVQPGVVSGGGGLVAWPIPGSGGRDRLALVTRSRAGAPFTAEQVITAAGHHDVGELRVDPGGPRVLISAAESFGGHYRAVLRTWSPTAGLSVPRILSGASSGAFAPAAAGNPVQTVVAWQQDGIVATRAPAGGAFASPVTLSSPGLTVASGGGPEVAVDGRGVALAAWIDYGRDGSAADQVELARDAG